MKLKKEWLYATLVLVGLWVVGNIILTGLVIIGGDEFFGESDFFSAFIVSLTIEFAAIVSASILSIAFFWLFKSILTNNKK